MRKGTHLLLAMPGVLIATVLPAPAAAAAFHLLQGSSFSFSQPDDQANPAPFLGRSANRLWGAQLERSAIPAARRFSWSLSPALADFDARSQTYAGQFARHLHFQRMRLLGLNGTAPFPLAAFEMGSKSRLLGDRLLINTDVFRYRYGGYRLTMPGGRGYGAAATLPSLGASSRMTGADVQLAYSITRRDSAALNASYAYGRRSSLLTLATDRQITNLHSLQIVPSYEHVIALTDGRSLTFDAAAIYRSSGRVTSTPLGLLYGIGTADPIVRRTETTRFDASLTYRSSPRLSLSAFVRNVTDVHPDRSSTLTTGNAVSPATVSAVLSEPRTFGLSLNAHL